jgi:hypothetical protein
MNKVFYHLRDPSSSGEHRRYYGKPEWARRYGRAEWSDKVLHMGDGRFNLLPRRVDLTIILPSPSVGDFVWTWYSDCIVTDSTLSLFREDGFTGFEARPVTVERVKGLARKRRAEVQIPPLWELAVIGIGGAAAAESGIHVIDHREDGSPVYSSFRNGIIVDEANWDGSDFLTINEYPGYLSVTERVKELIISHNLTNCTLIPSHELEWGSDSHPEDDLAESRALVQQDVSSLIADLANPDKDLSHVSIIYALGEKREPKALDHLFKTFTHPDGVLQGSAAGAVANMYKHKETPEQLRTVILPRLRSMLNDENPDVRKNSAEAIAKIGGEGAGEEMIRLLEDPDAWVRNTAVFQIGRLAYKPAIEAVRRATKDPDRVVRNRAREVLRELTEP